MPRVWQFVAASVALFFCASSCWGDRPLRRPKVDAGRPSDARDAVAPVDVPAANETHPPDMGSIFIPNDDAAVDLASDLPPETVACGDDGQPCCDQGCNLGLACEKVDGSARGRCTKLCGQKDLACCPGGGCEPGTSCSTNDETGTCKPCGLPHLTCCRGDCWIGVCEYSDAPRYCVACGRVNQPCCDQHDTEPFCEKGAVCEKPAGARRGLCVPE